MLRDVLRSGAGWLSLASALVLAGCGDSTQPPAESGAIEGAVHDDQAAAVVGVTLRLRAQGSGTDLATAQSDANGDYGFEDVEVGDYDVLLQVPAATEVTGSNPLAVTVEDGATATADFELELLPVSFAQHVQPALAANCTLGGCHAGTSPPQGLNLEEGQAYGETVNVPSGEMPALDRIEPGSPGDSYLVRKIEGAGIVGGRMPLGRAPLPQPVIEMIRRWVSEGALDN